MVVVQIFPRELIHWLISTFFNNCIASYSRYCRVKGVVGTNDATQGSRRSSSVITDYRLLSYFDRLIIVNCKMIISKFSSAIPLIFSLVSMWLLLVAQSLFFIWNTRVLTSKSGAALKRRITLFRFLLHWCIFNRFSLHQYIYIKREKSIKLTHILSSLLLISSRWSKLQSTQNVPATKTAHRSASEGVTSWLMKKMKNEQDQVN